MKASLEQISPTFGSSFSIRKFTRPAGRRAPKWHFHPEYEIVFVTNGRGKRHIAQSISYYEDGDLIFLGPNLPHYGFCDLQEGFHEEVVVQLKEDFLGHGFFDRPEMAAIKLLFERAKTGLSFNGPIKQLVGDQLIHLLQADNFKRLLGLLEVLQLMAQSQEFVNLNANGFSFEVAPQDQHRMSQIYSYVQANFQHPISLEEIADQVSMTVPSFCRYFKQLTAQTFTQFVNEFRVHEACRLLQESEMSISTVCHDSGFNNISHFNKQFRHITGYSPSAYRKRLVSII